MLTSILKHVCILTSVLLILDLKLKYLKCTKLQLHQNKLVLSKDAKASQCCLTFSSKMSIFIIVGRFSHFTLMAMHSNYLRKLGH